MLDGVVDIVRRHLNGELDLVLPTFSTAFAIAGH